SLAYLQVPVRMGDVGSGMWDVVMNRRGALPGTFVSHCPAGRARARLRAAKRVWRRRGAAPGLDARRTEKGRQGQPPRRVRRPGTPVLPRERGEAVGSNSSQQLSTVSGDHQVMKGEG